MVTSVMVNKQQQFYFWLAFSIFALKNNQELALFESINRYRNII